MRTTKANFSYFIWNWILRCILCLSKLRLIDVVNRSRQLRNSKVKYIDSFFTRPSPRGRVVFSLKPSTCILTACKDLQNICWLRNELTCTPIQTIKLKTRLRNLSFFFFGNTSVHYLFTQRRDEGEKYRPLSSVFSLETMDELSKDVLRGLEIEVCRRFEPIALVI